MGDPNWQKMPSAERKAADRARTKYLHVSVLVGMAKQEFTLPDGQKISADVPTRTPKGKGGTARKNPDVEKLINGARRV